MILRYPSYYKRFSCIAQRCEDTCCAGWEIDIDDRSYQYYMSVEGEFGERLRRSIREYQPEDQDVYESHGFILGEDRRCPFLDGEGLCDLYRELGEEALCDVCTDTPRNFLEYGGAREISISAACAEAGRLIYTEAERITFVEEETMEELDWEEGEEEKRLARQIRWARDRAIRILQNRQVPIEERIQQYLSFSEEVQDCLNANEPERISGISWEPYLSCPEKAEEVQSRSVQEEGQYQMFLQRMVTYTRLDSVSEEWESLLRQLQEKFVEPENGASLYARAHRRLRQELAAEKREYEYEHLMVYHVFTCQARCVDDFDFIGKAKLAVVSYLMIRDLDALRLLVRGSYEREDRVDIARIYAREVEHSEENLEFLADEFLFEEAYSPESLRRTIPAP